MIRRIVLVVFFGLLCNPLFILAQDSLAVKDLNEEKELKFQNYFFKALSEKSIKNYQKSIENLEFCNELIPNNAAVFFEFSKNYFFLNRYQMAKQFIQKALNIDANNTWMQLHLVEIYKKEKDYSSAISILKKITLKNPRKKEDLVRLYYLNRNYIEAMTLMNEIEKESGLSRSLESLKISLAFRKGSSVQKEVEDLPGMISKFEEKSSFALLKKLLNKAITEDISIFHKYSEKALDLFPAQPYSYLMQGQSLQIQNKLKDALVILETGVDFVVDNPKLEFSFYELMAKVHDSLGNVAKAQEYRNKAKKLNTVK